MFGENLKVLREKARLTQMEFAEKIGINRSTIADYETGSYNPKHQRLVRIAAFFNTTVDQLISGHVGKTDTNSQDTLRVLAITVDKSGDENIEFVPQHAQAGYLKGYSDLEFLSALPKFSLPKLPRGTHRAFEIAGDSMPPIKSGSIVVGAYVENVRDITDNERYILVTRDTGIVFKRVKRGIKTLQLISDNVNYPPYLIAEEDLIEAWAFNSFIGYNDDNHSLDKVEVIIEKLNVIENKIDFIMNK
jgi:transcriptional regulator with XRE-family HTH domain